MNSKKICLFLLSLAISASSISLENVAAKEKEDKISGYDIYVAVNGSNTDGDGSEAKPYATLDKAREAARELSSDTHNVRVSIGEGKYFVGEPIVFDAKDSNVTYVGDHAVLTGAKTLTDLTWENYSDSIKVASVESGQEIDQLFIDGEQQILSRYPNYDPEQVLQGSATLEEVKARSKNWSDPAGGYIRSLHQKKWGGNSYKIKGKDNSSLGLTYEWVGDNNRGSEMLSSTIMVENIFEELDSPGEWYYDYAKKKLYVYPREGTDLENSVVEGAVTEEILHVEGVEDGEQVRNLTFDGITLENTKRTMFTGTYVPLMRSDWCVVRSGALFIQNAEDVTFKNGMVRNIGGNGVFLSGHSKNVLIDNNEIINIGSSGVQVVGFPDSCREPSFWEYTNPLRPEVENAYVHKTTIEDTTKGPAKEHYPREAVISNNHIQNVGIWEKQSSQVALSVAYKIQILHNTLHDGPRAGINIGDGTFGGHELAYNDIFDVQKETDDHGMFNSWGRDRFWSLGGYDTQGWNGAAKEPYSLLDVIEPIEIHDNRMHFGGRLDGGSTFGIDLDDGSTNYKIYNNLCLNMGIKLREGFHREVYNNILVNGQINLHCTYEDSYDVIERNIVVKGNPYSLATTDEYRFRVSEDRIDNNWFYDPGMTASYPDFWTNLGYDVNSVNANPLFKDTSSNDYTVMNTESMGKVNFKNFPMNQFGKPGCEYKAPVYEKTEADGNQDMLEREDWLGATISIVDDAIMSSTGAGGVDGVYMEKVLQDSQAAIYGFKAGDVLKSLNGETIGEKSSFVSKYNEIEEGNIVNIKLVRNQLTVSLNFMKTGSEKIIDDQDSVIKYSGGTWEESTPDNNASNALNCIDKTLTAMNVGFAEDVDDISVEVPFYGTQIKLFSRMESNLGEYKIVIVDETGEQVQESTCSAYIEGKKDAQLIFNSNVFPQGDYTLRLTRISGDYVIIDAFKVFTKAEGEINDVVTEPITVTDNNVRVTELTSGKELKIEVPLKSNQAEPIDITAAVLISGNEGVLQLEMLTKEDITLASGNGENVQLSIKTPENSESKRLEVYVYGKESGQPYAYPYLINGKNIVQKEVTILDESNNGVIYTYTSEDRLLTIAAGGFTSGEQVLLQISNENGDMIGLRQVKVEENGQAKAAFILSEHNIGQLSLKMKDEKGLEKTETVEISEGVDILDKSALGTAVKVASDIVNDEEIAAKYTKDSWMEFYNSYYRAMEKLESDTGSQSKIIQATNELLEAHESLQLMEETGEYVPSQANRGEKWQVYDHEGVKDSGDFDSGKGDWMVRKDHIDTTVKGAYVEFKGNFTSFSIEGANKEDSADFRVIIKDEITGEETEEEVILSRNGFHEEIYAVEGMNNNAKSISVYHNGQGQDKSYLELWKVAYTELADASQQVSELTGIEITKLPNIIEYRPGYEGEISLLGGELTETYSDGSTNVIPMNSSMYESGFDIVEVGLKEIFIRNNGQQASFTITVKQEGKYFLSVVNGIGSGEYEAGTEVEISAEDTLDGKKFAGWMSSDGGSFENAQDNVTLFIMPANNTVVTAQYGEDGGIRKSLELVVAMAEKMEAQQIENNCYTAETWQAVQEALDNARALLEKPDASQNEIDNAFLELITACNLLENGVQKIGLKAAIEGVEMILADEDAIREYTSESVEAVRTALAEAQRVYQESSADQETVNSASRKLMDVVTSMLLKEENTRLRILIRKAEELLKNEDQYTSSSIEKLKSVIEAAKKVDADSQAADKEISEAYNSLAEAMASLVRKANKEELRNALEKSGEILNESDKYLEESIAGLQAAADESQGVYDREDADADTVGETLKMLVNEILKARLMGDVNLDGTVDTEDSAEVLIYAAELNVLTEEQGKVADVNCDGSSDSDDAALILQYASEKIAKF